MSAKLQNKIQSESLTDDVFQTAFIEEVLTWSHLKDSSCRRGDTIEFPASPTQVTQAPGGKPFACSKTRLV
jgi:hypothetical protein